MICIKPYLLFALMACLTGLTTCGQQATQPITDGIGPHPVLPPPHTSVIPTVRIAPAIGWPAGKLPNAAPGTQVAAFAKQLQHPRWLYVLPNGDVLVAETNAPPKPEDGKGIKGKLMGWFMKVAGADAPSANRIRLLRDRDGDGIAETQSVLLQHLNSPFGMVLVGPTLYVANTDAIIKFHYQDGALTISDSGQTLTKLPAGPINHHWTKNLIASQDGSKLYVTVGSNSNVAERGMAVEKDRAAILEVDTQTGQRKVFASGLRNPNGMAWEPESGALWTVVNERDELGSDLVPDYLTLVKAGGFYGWPYSYYGQHVDSRVQPPSDEQVANALVPDYALGAHTAALGLVYSAENTLPSAFHKGMFISQHGSWNSKPRSGYKVIFVPFQDGQPKGKPIDVMTGFLSREGEAYGRPVGVAMDKQGALLVADDVGNTVWRVFTTK